MCRNRLKQEPWSGIQLTRINDKKVFLAWVSVRRVWKVNVENSIPDRSVFYNSNFLQKRISCVRKDGRTNRRTVRWTDRRTDRQTNILNSVVKTSRSAKPLKGCLAAIILLFFKVARQPELLLPGKSRSARWVDSHGIDIRHNLGAKFPIHPA